MGTTKAHVDFGYGRDSNMGITKDGELLATLGFSLDELNNDKMDGNDDVLAIFNKFVDAGGDDSHSGYSWSCVRSVAMVLVKHGWKTVDEIPADNPLHERVIVRNMTP